MSGDVAVNDSTGEVFLLRGGAWQPARTAVGPEGQRLYLDGSRWAVLPSGNAAPATLASSVVTGAADPIHGGAQLLANALPTGVVSAVNDATAWVNRQPVIGPITRALGMTPATPEQLNARVAQREADYNASRRAAQPEGELGTDWARVGGQVAATLPAMLAAGAPTTALRAAGLGAAQGAVSGAVTPVTDPSADYWETVGSNAVTGAGLGAAGGAVGYGAGRLISGAQNVNPQVRALANEGAQLTPGQALGGMARRLEDAGTSIPFLGDQIIGAQRRGVEQFNRVVANRVLQPLGQQVDNAAPVGRDLLDDVYRRINAAYDAVVPNVRPFRPDQQWGADMLQAAQQFQTPDMARQFVRNMNDRIRSRMRAAGGTLNGETFQQIDRELGQTVARYGRSQSPADQELAAATREVQGAFRDLLERTNPALAADLRAARASFARYVRMERAANSQAATNGVFTPQMFSRAVALSDGSVRRGAAARGGALMQDLSDAGRAVLPSTVADSGTARRVMTGAMLGGVGYGAGIGLPTAAALGAGGLAAYSPMGQRAMQAVMLGQRPPAIAATGNILASLGAPSAVPLTGFALSAGPPGSDQYR